MNKVNRRLFFAIIVVITAKFHTMVVYAADFSNVQQIFVPASRIIRRHDINNMQMQEPSFYPSHNMSLNNPLPSSTFVDIAPPFKAPHSKTKYGLIPPPPPLPPVFFAPPPAQSAPFQTTQENGVQSPIRSDNTLTNKSIGPKNISAAAKSHPSSVKIEKQVQALLNKGRLDEAQRLLKSYLKPNRTDDILRTSLVKILVEKARNDLSAGNLDLAKKTAREALTWEPSNKLADSILNQALSRSGIDPKNAESRIKEATDLVNQNRLSEAKVEYQVAQRLKPSAQSHVGLGNIMMSEKQLEGAKVEFERSLELEPNEQIALRQLGIAEYMLNDMVGANLNLSQALVLNPKDKIASRILIELWHHQVSKNPQQTTAHLGLARAYQLAGELKSAENEYLQVAQIDPQNSSLAAAQQSLRFSLSRKEALKALDAAKTLESQGVLKEAHEKAMEAIDLYPHSIEIRLFLANLCEKLGLINEAHEQYMLTLRDDPTNLVAAQSLKRLSFLPTATVRSVRETISSTENPKQIKQANAIKFELENIGITPTDISLKVVIKNDCQEPLILPDNLKAVIRSSGKKDKPAKIFFPTNTIPIGGQLHGIVKVPGHLSPNADCYLLKILPDTTQNQDLCLTVPSSTL